MATYNNYLGNSSNRQPDTAGDLTTRPQGTAPYSYPTMRAPTPALQAGAAPLTPCEAAALMGRPLSTAGLPPAAYAPGSQWTPGMAPAAMQAGQAVAPSAGPGLQAAAAGMMVPAAQMPSYAPAYPAPSIYATTSAPATARQMVVGEPPPMTVTSPYYFAGKLNQYLGRLVRVEFVLGTSGQISDRIGILIEVGASFITLQPLATDDVLICDLYSIKFVTVYLGPAAGIGAG